MKIPLSWLREFVSLPDEITSQQIDDAFVRVGFEVESIEIQGADLTGPLVVALVKDIEQLEGHKKPIRYVALDCGEKEIRYVICGATNFAVGDLVVAALPGAVLPGNFVISARETYGKTSNGMICSSRELGLSDEHSGIIVLPPGCASPGTDAIELLEIDDHIIDVSVNPDRGYALSARGLARELAASLSLSFQDPASKVDSARYSANSDGIAINIVDSSAASVGVLRTIKDFKAESPTPLWMSRRIEKCGMRSISLAVDITNYVMLELGQPLHAFDAEKISGSLQIRRAGSEKTFVTLDGQERKLSPENLMVADDKVSLALAGTMGGLSSEVTPATTQIALEGVRFNPVDIAKNSRNHKLSSEASRRLERAVDPLLAEISTARATDLLIDLGGAKYVGTSISGKPELPNTVVLNPAAIPQLLGFEIPDLQIREKLEIVGCTVTEETKASWKVSPPSWRSDLQLPADFAEEVARLIGFEAIPSRLPTGKTGAQLSVAQLRKRSIAQLLSSRGFAEVYNYPFISPDLVASLGYKGDRAAAFTLANPMSDENPELRTHLLPGLMATTARNIGRGNKDIAIFEIGSVFRNLNPLIAQRVIPTDSRPSAQDMAEIYASVPEQPIHLGAVITGHFEQKGWNSPGRVADWNDAIGLAISIVEATGNPWELSRSDFAPWHPGRCAELLVNGKPVSHAGELHPRACAIMGIPERSVAFVVNLSALPFAEISGTPIIRTMPAAIQDIALVVSQDVPASDVESAVRIGAGDLLESITLFDRYDKLEDDKVSLAYSLVFRASDRTLTADEVSGYRLAAAENAGKMCGAVIRS